MVCAGVGVECIKEDINVDAGVAGVNKTAVTCLIATNLIATQEKNTRKHFPSRCSLHTYSEILWNSCMTVLTMEKKLKIEE